MSKFHVGDQVRVSDAYPDTSLHGSRGVVMSLPNAGVGTSFYGVTMRDGGGDVLYFRENELRPADIRPLNFSEAEFGTALKSAYLGDPVSRPQHYTQGMPEGVEVIDIIRAQDAGFEHANVIKYILRWKYKNGVEDLKKAQQYLQWLIEKEDADNE